MLDNYHYKHISVSMNGVEYGIEYSFLSVKIEEIEDDNRNYIVVNVQQYFGDLSSLVLDFEKTRKMISELSICMNAIKNYCKQSKAKNTKIEFISSIVGQSE